MVDGGGGNKADAPYSLEQLQDGLRHPVFRFIWGEKVIRWHYLLRRYCSRQRV